MAREKVIYGTSIMKKSFWAYAVKANKVVLVRCATRDDAIEERARMRMSEADTIGSTNRAISEADMWTACKCRGWKLEVIR